MRDRRRKTNSWDIAHLAGVSQSTVSRALRGDPMVCAITRQRILDVARQLNYHVDKNASSLRRQHTGTLALLFFEEPTTDDSAINPFFHSMLGSIIRACSRQGYDLLVSFQDLLRDWLADYEDSHKADGIILLGYGDYLAYRDRLETLIAIGPLGALRATGRRLPEDAAVVGFDGIPMGAVTRPALTTVSQDTKRAGEVLVASLINQIDGRSVENMILPPRLVVRESCGGRATIDLV